MVGALEEIDDGFGRRVNGNRDALDGVVLNSFVKNLGSKALNPDSWPSELWPPITGSDCHPYNSRNTVGELVKGER